jgi:hypothetical protein
MALARPYGLVGRLADRDRRYIGLSEKSDICHVAGISWEEFGKRKQRHHNTTDTQLGQLKNCLLLQFNTGKAGYSRVAPKEKHREAENISSAME